MPARIVDEVLAFAAEGQAEALLGVEGLPFSGKTTFAARLGNRLNLTVVDEHMVFEPALVTLGATAWPADANAMLDRQRQFLRVEVERSGRAAAADGGAVMDRTAISLIAYLYLRVHDSRSTFDIVRRFIEDCHSELVRRRIVVPRHMRFLRAAPALVLLRAQRLLRAGDSRRTEPFLLRKDVLERLHEFYFELAARMPGRAGDRRADACPGR